MEGARRVLQNNQAAGVIEHMSIYMVTWETTVINGRNSKGHFFSECEILSIDDAMDARDNWVLWIDKKNPNRLGGEILITGAFKL